MRYPMSSTAPLPGDSSLKTGDTFHPHKPGMQSLLQTISFPFLSIPLPPTTLDITGLRDTIQATPLLRDYSELQFSRSQYSCIHDPCASKWRIESHRKFH